jgi:hypothetical protein
MNAARDDLENFLDKWQDRYDKREPRHELDEASMPLDIWQMEDKQPWWTAQDADQRWIEAQQDQDWPPQEGPE